MTGELAAVERIRQILPAPPGAETWMGDDAAVVSPPLGRLVLTADAVVAGVHADLSLVALDDVGWKAMAAAVSDIAAMGAEPGYALVTVCGPAHTDLDLLYAGVAEAAAAYGCPVVGGDLSGGAQLTVVVAVAGDAGSRAPVLRSGARPDDVVFLTGPVGSSAAGLRVLRTGGAGADDRRVQAHCRPRARVVEGRVARLSGATAMIDVSDGLAADLHHVAEASSVGIVLDEVPVAEGATLEEALGGGEDYELVFTAAAATEVSTSFAEAGLDPPLVIGRCTVGGPAVELGGQPLARLGWEHAWRP